MSANARGHAAMQVKVSKALSALPGSSVARADVEDEKPVDLVLTGHRYLGEAAAACPTGPCSQQHEETICVRTVGIPLPART